MLRVTIIGRVRRGFLAAGIFGLAVPAQAALPPEWQRVRELNAVIDAAVPLLDGKPIDAVEWSGGTGYTVRAEECTLELTIEFTPTQITGPAAFEVVPGKLKC